MKSQPLSHDSPLPNDKAAMIYAITALQEAGIQFMRPTLHQLKIGPWNFYPIRGTIFHDGCEKAERESGVAALIARIEMANSTSTVAISRVCRPTIVK